MTATARGSSSSSRRHHSRRALCLLLRVFHCRTLSAGGRRRAAVRALLLDLQRPIENIIVDVALAVEEVAEELPQVRVVGLVVKAQRATKVEIGRKLRRKALAQHFNRRANFPLADALVLLLLRGGLGGGGGLLSVGLAVRGTWRWRACQECGRRNRGER